MEKVYELQLDNTGNIRDEDLKERTVLKFPTFFEVMDWLSGYFGTFRENSKVDMLKQAMFKVNEKLTNGNVGIYRPYYGLESTILMLRNWKEGKIVFHFQNKYVMISFANSKIRTQNKKFDEFVQKSIKNCNLKRNWTFIKNLFDLDKDFLCFRDQGNFFGKYCFDDFDMPDKSQLYDLLRKKTKNSKTSRTKFIIHRALLRSFKKVYNEYFYQVMLLLNSGCYRFDSSLYFDFVEDLMAFVWSAGNILNLRFPQWINIYCALIKKSLPKSIPNYSITRILYRLYLCILQRFNSNSYYNYDDFKAKYYAFIKKDLCKRERIFEFHFGLKVSCKGELFIMCLLGSFAFNNDIREIIELLRDVLILKISFELASEKFLMLTHPLVIEAYTGNSEVLKNVRHNIRCFRLKCRNGMMLKEDSFVESFDRAFEIVLSDKISVETRSTLTTYSDEANSS